MSGTEQALDCLLKGLGLCRSLTAWQAGTKAETELPSLEAPKETHTRGQYWAEALEQNTTWVGISNQPIIQGEHWRLERPQPSQVTELAQVWQACSAPLTALDLSLHWLENILLDSIVSIISGGGVNFFQNRLFKIPTSSGSLYYA